MPVRRKPLSKSTSKKVPAAKRPLSGAAARAHATKRAPARKPPAVAKDKQATATKVASKAQDLNPARMTGMEKAEELRSFAEGNGWWTDLTEDKSAGTITVMLKRVDGPYKEMITAEWRGNRVAKNGVLYTVQLEDGPKRTLVVHNVSAARKHISGERLMKRDAKERKPRRQRRAMRAVGGDDDGDLDEGPRYTPVGAHIVDKWYDLVVTKAVTVKRGNKKVRTTKVVAQMEGLGTSQVDSQRRIWEADGLTVTTKERVKNA